VLKADMTRMFGAHGRLGLFDVLSNKSLDIGGVMLRTNVPKLTFVPAGTVREVAAEKLASEMMRELTIELAQRYADRIVVFDCPPILATTGAVALAPHVGQILMVVEAWRTPQQTIKSAIQLMDQVEITGLVLNKTREKINKGKYYYYQYGYGYPQKTTPKEY
jgi:receptor protein-tyrosine kinase